MYPNTSDTEQFNNKKTYTLQHFPLKKLDLHNPFLFGNNPTIDNKLSLWTALWNYFVIYDGGKNHVIPFFRGRLRHGRHFTFQSSNSDIAITLVSVSVTGSIATREHPYSACGNWLQVSLPRWRHSHFRSAGGVCTPCVPIFSPAC